MSLNPVEEIIEDIRLGRMVVIMDDEDRENEGDLVMAASLVRPEDVNFMARYGRGLICLTLTQERCRQLRLPLMVIPDQSRPGGTNFTVSIEAAEGVTTGISAADRALTIRTAVAPEAKPEDLVQPGHIFPLMAQPGGVLTRAGHTEAGCDLARLAGLEPAAVIVEILNDDGTMARRPDLTRFAETHGLKIGTIEDLIRYRIRHEKTVERMADAWFPSRYGNFRLIAYEDKVDRQTHLALVHGEIDPTRPVAVRVHIENPLCDLLAGRQDCGWPLSDALERISHEPAGVAVILRHQEPPGELVRRISRLALDRQAPMPDAEPTGREAEREPTDLRTYGIGAQILVDVGVRKMRILSAPKKFHALAGFGLEVDDYIYDGVEG